MMLIARVETDINWINDFAVTPVVGHLFLFVMIFVPAVIGSFLAQAIIPGLNNEIGFTKAMLLLLPTYNLIMWLSKIKLFLFFLLSWILLGGIAIIKTIIMITGN